MRTRRQGGVRGGRGNDPGRAGRDALRPEGHTPPLFGPARTGPHAVLFDPGGFEELVRASSDAAAANTVTNRGHDRSQLLEMAKAAQAEIGASEMIALADRGYYEGEQIHSCAEAGIIPMVPKPNTSPAQVVTFGARQCSCMSLSPTPIDALPARSSRNALPGWRAASSSVSISIRRPGDCTSRPLCTAGKEKRIRQWEHEAVLDAMQDRLDAMPEAMAIRRCTVEHVFGTIKGWMGATHSERAGSRTSPPKPAWRSWPTTSSALSQLLASPRPSRR